MKSSQAWSIGLKYKESDKTFKSVIFSSLMLKALEVELWSWQMLIMINGDKKKEVKHESVRIKRIVLDLHGVIVDLGMVVLFKYE